MYSLRRRILSQNFLHNRKLVQKLVRHTSLCPDDTVLDIGVGKGILTDELIKHVKKVIGIEVDISLYGYLKKKYINTPHIELVNSDFLLYKTPSYSYKVFANIPFSIEGKIIRKLLSSDTPPLDTYLVMRKDLAERLSGVHKECQFSISYKPWFDFEIMYKLRKTDFTPYARMDTVLLCIKKKELPLLPDYMRSNYMKFINTGYGTGKKVKMSLNSFFRQSVLHHIAVKNNFSINDSPSRLTVNQWIALYKSYLNQRGI